MLLPRAMNRLRWLIPLVVVVALVAFLAGYFFFPAEPLRDQLNLVQFGMTQDEVVEILGEPNGFGELRSVDVMTYKGRTGVAQVQIDRMTGRVVFTRWTDRSEREWWQIWRSGRIRQH